MSNFRSRMIRFFVRPTHIYMVAAVLLLLALLVLTACGSPSKPVIQPPGGILTEETQEALRVRRDAIMEWTIRRDGGPAKESQEDMLGDVGDGTLFAGLLCASGDAQACNAVRDAQGEDGRWWRAPSRIGKEGDNTFSRDMTMGVLLYFAMSRDVQAAQRWMSYVEKNNGNTCATDTDGRCALTPFMWSSIRLVWLHLGLPLNTDMRLSQTLVGQRAWEGEARSRPPGFNLHLVSVTLFLFRKMNIWNESYQTASSILVERQPGNPWFLFLRDGKTEALASALLSRSQAEEPEGRREWSYERAEEDRAWESTMGWEHVTLINLMIGQ